MYINEPIKKYLNDLSAKLPAPGGGSAAALVGAAGTALMSMVCNFTVGKKNYKDVESDVKRILSQAEEIREKLESLIDKDVDAYNAYSSSDRSDEALKKILAIPLNICRLSHKALTLCPELSRKGNKFLISDVRCAAEMLEAAFYSALFNVRINLSYFKDEKYSLGFCRVIEPLIEETSFLKTSVVTSVSGKAGKK